ncbi:MAG TPA: glutamine--fructose-6-phosphate transaminase (isomerizing), partial [Chitinophagaceae bacterium]|nr:glutamine--fructose-6-phosphate transaminase (isomerizing) [Chitinophagaceae bacterium]
MCGIVGYIGPKQAYPVLIKGLKRLEYRGYDSAGVALLNGSLQVLKKEGKVSVLEEFSQGKNLDGTVGIGHTRWATHGEPCDRNAHPHLSRSGNLAIIHNGIIENYNSLKKELSKLGYTFESDTDTEVLVNLIEDIQKEDKLTLEEAVRVALNEVIGAYAILVIDRNEPDKMIAARKGSPLVIGIGKGEYYVASDASPIIEYTNNVVYLNDEEMAIICRDKELEVKTLANIQKSPYVQKLEMDLEMIEKGGYEHFMLKEIYEQPQVIRDCMRGRMNAEKGWIKLGGVSEYASRINNAKRFIITACGTSWHSGLIAEYLIEELARVPVEVEYASE